MENKIEKIRTEIIKLRKSVELFSANKASLEQQVSKAALDIAAIESDIEKNTEGHSLISQSIQIMYESLSSRLGDIITEGIHCVFPDSPYSKFVVEFVPRRDTVEADLFLIDASGEKYHPVNAVGGGVADLIALLLRIAYIKLSPYKDILIADEPLKFVDRSRIEEAAKFISQVCKDLDFSLLIVTHIPELVKVSDAIYRVLRKNGVSSVTKLNVVA